MATDLSANHLQFIHQFASIDHSYHQRHRIQTPECVSAQHEANADITKASFILDGMRAGATMAVQVWLRWYLLQEQLLLVEGSYQAAKWVTRGGKIVELCWTTTH